MLPLYKLVIAVPSIWFLLLLPKKDLIGKQGHKLHTTRTSLVHRISYDFKIIDLILITIHGPGKRTHLIYILGFVPRLLKLLVQQFSQFALFKAIFNNEYA